MDSHVTLLTEVCRIVLCVWYPHSFQDSKKVEIFDVLSAVCVLHLYEVLAYTSRYGWVQHSQGVKSLVKMRGPGYYRAGPARAFLIMSRVVIIFEALEAKQECFQEQGEWQDIFGRMMMIQNRSSISPTLHANCPDS